MPFPLRFITSGFVIFVKSNNSLSSASTINTIGFPFIELESVNSTNNYAFDKLQSNLAAHGTTFFAHAQTAGKGQRGKTWLTEPGSNIALSVILEMSFQSIHQQFPLSMATALAALDLFRFYAGDEACIKWPNDIYWRDRKAGGILIESSISTNPSGLPIWKWAVAGIGMNINQTNFPENLTNPVSLKQITGRHFVTVDLAKQLCRFLDTRFQQLKNGETERLLADYNSRLFRLGATARLKKQNAAFQCTIEGVNLQGELMVSGAAQDSFHFGEVQWVF